MASSTRDAALVRPAILDAATVVFSELGFQGATTRAIAVKAGLEQGHLSYYFSSKEGLWIEVMNSLLATFEEDLIARNVGPMPVGEALREIASFLLCHHTFSRLILQLFSYKSPRQSWLREQLWPILERCAHTGFKGISGGATADEDNVLRLRVLIGTLVFIAGASEFSPEEAAAGVSLYLNSVELNPS
jgi:TetR/AcrR family transcriptional regulator